MRIAVPLITLLFLSQLVSKAHGIRLEQESLAVFTKQINPGKDFHGSTTEKRSSEGLKVDNEKESLHDSIHSGAMKKNSMRKENKGHDQLIPTFQEDYYGPRDHKPKHH
ncbi:hypothetical protein LUZ60_000896 [Juncus effusus]|nr:hypothetical protein LUZ60_000896 [Juncus effusus]